MKKKPSSLHTRENDLHAVKIRKKKKKKTIEEGFIFILNSK